MSVEKFWANRNSYYDLNFGWWRSWSPRCHRHRLHCFLSLFVSCSPLNDFNVFMHIWWTLWNANSHMHLLLCRFSSILFRLFNIVANIQAQKLRAIQCSFYILSFFFDYSHSLFKYASFFDPLVLCYFSLFLTIGKCVCYFSFSKTKLYYANQVRKYASENKCFSPHFLSNWKVCTAHWLAHSQHSHIHTSIYTYDNLDISFSFSLC